MYRILLRLLVIISYISLTRTLPTYEGLEGVNEFSLQLLENIASEEENNFVVSSATVWNVFTLLAEGASGSTFDELILKLNLPKNPKLTRELYASANEVLSKNHTDVLLQRLTSIYIDQKLQVHKDFVDSASRSYNAIIREVDDTDLNHVADVINYDVCEATEGLIKEVVTIDVLNNFRMILIDAIYFNAKWTVAFDPKDTTEQDFYDDRGRKVGSVNMMYQKAQNAVVYLDEISAQVLEITYGPEKEFAFIILTPYESISLKRLIKNLSNYRVKNIFDNLKKQQFAPEIECFIPRFNISSDLDLMRPLKYLGLNEIFDSERASLPGISDNKLFVSKVIQKAVVQVTEEGTVSAAATLVKLQDRIGGFTVTINKPFLFMITEKKSNLILFSGMYTNPSLV